MKTNPELRAIAKQIFDANQKRDYALASHLLKSYRPGTVERERIDAELTRLAAEVRAANPPAYFR